MKKRRTIEIFASSILCLSLLTGCTIKQVREEAKYTYELTEGKLSEIEVGVILGADLSYINCGFKDANYVRTLVSKDKPIYIVPTEKFIKWNNYAVKNLVNELNTIFEIINPDIKFIYQETMPNNRNNIITINVAEELDSTGVTYMKDYVRKNGDVYNYDCEIIINKNYWSANFLVELDELLAHEVGHVLGLGHPHEFTMAKTVMSCEGASGPNGYYTLNDMYSFATLYGGFNSKEEVLEVKSQLENYYTSLEENSFIPKLPNNPLFDFFKPLPQQEKPVEKWFDKVNDK